MVAKGTGCIEFENFKLKEVIYVPELSANLLSVNAITEGGGEVLFVQNKVTVTYKNKTVMEGHKLKNGLFQIKLKAINKNKSYMAENFRNIEATWHRKLGHISNENLKTLKKISEGMKLKPADIKESKKVCETCLNAKQTRTKFDNSRIKASRSLQIIHTDLAARLVLPQGRK